MHKNWTKPEPYELLDKALKHFDSSEGDRLTKLSLDNLLTYKDNHRLFSIDEVIYHLKSDRFIREIEYDENTDTPENYIPNEFRLTLTGVLFVKDGGYERKFKGEKRKNLYQKAERMITIAISLAAIIISIFVKN